MRRQAWAVRPAPERPGAAAAPAPGGSSVGGSASVCELPSDSGPCNAAFSRYFHDSASGLCKAFLYGGCGGNENNFESFEDCVAACGSRALDSCVENSDCVLEAAACCGACGAGTIDDYVALNVADVKDYRSTQNCNGLLCGPCPDLPPFGGLPPFVATCEAGRCQVAELLGAGVFACEQDSDCHLRYGVGCCGGCGEDPNRFIAIGDEDKLRDLVCPSEPLGCPECAPTPPPCAVPRCNAGTCVIAEECP